MVDGPGNHRYGQSAAKKSLQKPGWYRGLKNRSCQSETGRIFCFLMDLKEASDSGMKNRNLRIKEKI